MNSKYWYVLNEDRLIVGGAFDTLESASKFARTKPDYFVVSNIGLQYL
jgi:thiamine monophosphate synthase